MSAQFAKNISLKKKNTKIRGQGLSRKQKMEVQSLVKEPLEKKFYDSAYATVPVSLIPSFTALTRPAEGTGPDQFTGATIDLISLQYRFMFQKVDTTNYIRFIIFQWFPDSTADSPSWEKMMQYNTAGLPASLYDLLSPYVLDRGSKSMFKTLVDKQFWLDSDDPFQLIEGFINKGFRKKIDIYDNAGTYDGTNHIYLMYVSDSGALGHPTITGHTRARFTDA